jgi:hypothetical protein
MRRRAPLLVAAITATAMAAPASASAHGIQQRANLPIPPWLFAWAAAAVLVISFAALAVLWPRPRLERAGWRPLPGALGRVLGSRALEAVAGAVGVVLLAVVVAAGYVGGGSALENLAPTFILITFWVGLVFASILFGDLFAALSPWRALGRLAGRTVGRGWTSRPYPERLGRWPAAGGVLVFAWIELVSGWGDHPSRLVTAALVYTALTLAAQAWFGVETWTRRGEAFACYFNLFSRMSVFERRDGVLGLRPPLSGLPRLDVVPGSVALITTMIGTVTYDGLSQGQAWRDLNVHVVDAFTSVGASPELAPRLSGTIGLLLGVGIVAGFYALGIEGARSVGAGMTAQRLRRAFVHCLVPIAAAYVAAHYLTFLVFEGQAIGYLASDPFGQGWDLFGTAANGIDYGLLSQEGAWYVQVGCVVAGHVAGLMLAHDRALALYRDAREAVRSQYWMLSVMVGFTSLALWLLAEAAA